MTIFINMDYLAANALIRLCLLSLFPVCTCFIYYNNKNSTACHVFSFVTRYRSSCPSPLATALPQALRLSCSAQRICEQRRDTATRRHVVIMKSAAKVAKSGKKPVAYSLMEMSCEVCVKKSTLLPSESRLNALNS